MRRKVVLQVLSMDELLFDLKTPNYIGRLKKMLAEAKGVRVVQVPYSQFGSSAKEEIKKIAQSL